MSNDFPFEEYGKKTGIHYGDTFNEYKQRIEIHKDSPLFRSIFAKWNLRLKLGVDNTNGSAMGNADSSSNQRAKVNARAASIDAALSNGLNNSPLTHFSSVVRQGLCCS